MEVENRWQGLWRIISVSSEKLMLRTEETIAASCSYLHSYKYNLACPQLHGFNQGRTDVGNVVFASWLGPTDSSSLVVFR